MGIVKSMTMGVNNFTLYQLKDKRNAENNVQYIAVDNEQQVYVSFGMYAFTIDHYEFQVSTDLKELYVSTEAGFQFDFLAFYRFIRSTFDEISFSFLLSTEYESTTMTIDIESFDRYIEMISDNEMFTIAITPDTEYMENSYTLKQFQKIYKDILMLIVNVTTFERLLNNGEIV